MWTMVIEPNMYGPCSYDLGMIRTSRSLLPTLPCLRSATVLPTHKDFIQHYDSKLSHEPPQSFVELNRSSCSESEIFARTKTDVMLSPLEVIKMHTRKKNMLKLMKRHNPLLANLQYKYK